MALAADITRDAYTATAGQDTFAYTFPIALASELQVYKNGTLLTLSTHYHVTGVGTPSGNVVLTTPAAALDFLVIRGAVPLTQGVSFTPNDPFPVAAMNAGLDYLMRATQQQQEELGRAPLFHPGLAARNIRLAPPVATNFLRYSADALTIETTALTIPEFPSTPAPGWINLLDYNAIGDGDPFTRSPRLTAFRAVLSAAGLPSHRRYSGGSDVAAACGQLAARS